MKLSRHTFQKTIVQFPDFILKEKEVLTAHVVQKLSDNSRTKFESVRAKSHSCFQPGYCVPLDSKHLKMLPDIMLMLDNGLKLVIGLETYMLRYQTTATCGWETFGYRLLLSCRDDSWRVECVGYSW